MQLIIDPQGGIRAIYADLIPLSALGAATIRRASHVEPNPDGNWEADLAPVGGPLLGPFAQRGEALAAETAWLETYWLTR